jgi:glycosyltransferase involved in cell wall biosynthesis
MAAQDYEDIEIIVVDDGSSDGTGELAENVLKRSAREFRVIKHEANMGESVARNSGLGSARGDYVMFFDADDIADPNLVSALLEAAAQDDSDAAICGYRVRYEDTGKERTIPVGLDGSRSRKYSAEELTVMFIFKQMQPALSALFKTSFLKTEGLEFTAGSVVGGDGEFLTKDFSRCGSINFTTGCHYIYVQHEDMTSITTRQTPEKSLSRYIHVTEAVCRAARYLAERAESPKVRDVAMNFMLADGLIRTMNVAARQHDKAKFYQTLHAPETRRALIASLRYLLRKPEVSIKAATLLTAPRLYFWMRSKS